MNIAPKDILNFFGGKGLNNIKEKRVTSKKKMFCF